MATELKLKQDDEENNNLLSASGSSVGAPSGQAAAGSAAPANRPATPSGRPNIQQYLKANQGAGEKLSSGIQSNVGRQATRLGEEVEKTRGQFGSQAGELEGKLGEQGSQRIQTAFKDPQSILNQQDQLSEFRRLQQQGYNPNIQTLGQTQQQAQMGLQQQQAKLAEQAGQAKTEGGRFQLLQSAFGQPTYSRGQQKLDQLFLQAQPGVGKQLQQNLQQIQSQAGQQVGALGQEAQAKLSALEGLSKSRADQIAKLLKTGSEEGLETDISGRGLEDIGTSVQQRMADAEKQISAGQALKDRASNISNLTGADLEALGLSRGMSTYDINNLNPFIEVSDKAAINAASVADPQEFARYRALQQLAGDTSGDIFSGATQAGGFKPIKTTENLNQLLEARKQYWEQDKLNEMLSKYAAEQGMAYQPSYTSPVNPSLAEINKSYQEALFSGNYGNLLNTLTDVAGAASDIPGTLAAINPITGQPVSFRASNELRGIQSGSAQNILAAQTADQMKQAMQQYTDAMNSRFGGGYGNFDQFWNVGNERNVGKQMYNYLQELQRLRQNSLNPNDNNQESNNFFNIK